MPRFRLVKATLAEADELMGWFDDESSVRSWGGPRFRYPFDTHLFRDDLRIREIPSYAVLNDSGCMVAFGQCYDKLGRGHLARLVVAPDWRGQRIGEVLIRKVIAKEALHHGYTEFSLYVYDANEAAIRCYRRAGFKAASAPPQDQSWPDMTFMLWSLVGE